MKVHPPLAEREGFLLRSQRAATRTRGLQQPGERPEPRVTAIHDSDKPVIGLDIRWRGEQDQRGAFHLKIPLQAPMQDPDSLCGARRREQPNGQAVNPFHQSLVVAGRLEQIPKTAFKLAIALPQPRHLPFHERGDPPVRAAAQLKLQQRLRVAVEETRMLEQVPSDSLFLGTAGNRRLGPLPTHAATRPASDRTSRRSGGAP